MFSSIFLSSSSSVFKIFNFPSLIYLGLEWSWGFAMIILYMFQVLSGLFLVLYFEVGLESCLNSKFFIIKEVFFGWAFSYFHMMSVGFIFLLIYIHIFKCLFYNVFSYFSVWFSGFVLLMYFLIVTFTGYSLVLGSLGFWALVIAMGLMEYVFGEAVSFMLFSDLSFISNLILYKLFCYHFFLSLSLGLGVMFHLSLIHSGGSSLGVCSSFMNMEYFYFISFWKDLVVLLGLKCWVVFFLGYFVEYFFNLENFVELNSFKVPLGLEPEGFFSIVFSVLKGNESKCLGLMWSFYSVVWFFMVVCFKGLFGEYMNFLTQFIFLIMIIYFCYCLKIWPSKFSSKMWFYFMEFKVFYLSLNILSYNFMGLVYMWSFIDFYYND